jgi:hypothetical protein
MNIQNSSESITTHPSDDDSQSTVLFIDTSDSNSDWTDDVKNNFKTRRYDTRSKFTERFEKKRTKSKISRLDRFIRGVSRSISYHTSDKKKFSSEQFITKLNKSISTYINEWIIKKDYKKSTKNDCNIRVQKSRKRNYSCAKKQARTSKEETTNWNVQSVSTGAGGSTNSIDSLKTVFKRSNQTSASIKKNSRQQNKTLVAHCDSLSSSQNHNNPKSSRKSLTLQNVQDLKSFKTESFASISESHLPIKKRRIVCVEEKAG